MAGTEREQRNFYFYFYFFEVSKNLGLEKSVRDWSFKLKRKVMSLVRRERGSGGVCFW
jgi:hypothetical protein